MLQLPFSRSKIVQFMEDLAVITDNFFRNICPGFFHGHYVQPLIHALKFIYRSLVQVRWTEHIL